MDVNPWQPQTQHANQEAGTHSNAPSAYRVSIQTQDVITVFAYPAQLHQTPRTTHFTYG